ncbi:hypothetical protein AB0M39_23695 [Streptomyces sp. NPDC051907]|uniref:hypothetical protein n=1 Tax=Streptomyces sp. NPDC051907 TaxID=3155284 RepID=UPI00341995F2
MSVARRPLLTATAAGTLLCALWFVPSANAIVEKQTGDRAPSSSTGGSQEGSASTDGTSDAASDAASDGSSGTSDSASDTLVLADTGSVDTTPYVVTGTAFLGIGAGFVAYSVRRRDAAASL